MYVFMVLMIVFLSCGVKCAAVIIRTIMGAANRKWSPERALRYLGCAVPQAVHGHPRSVVSVSHVDDGLSDGLDHLLNSQSGSRTETMRRTLLQRRPNSRSNDAAHRPRLVWGEEEEIQEDFVDQRVFDDLLSGRRGGVGFLFSKK